MVVSREQERLVIYVSIVRHLIALDQGRATPAILAEIRVFSHAALDHWRTASVVHESLTLDLAPLQVRSRQYMPVLSSLWNTGRRPFNNLGRSGHLPGSVGANGLSVCPRSFLVGPSAGDPETIERVSFTSSFFFPPS